MSPGITRGKALLVGLVIFGLGGLGYWRGSHAARPCWWAW